MIILIDNYDSFTFNVYQYLSVLGSRVKVVRNDAMSLAALGRLDPERLVISPGPGDPNSAGISLKAIEYFAGKIPILGICLGHQAIGQAFGGKVKKAPRMMHGKTSSIYHKKTGIYRGLPSPLTATRYHSLLVDRATLPRCLEVTAETDDGLIMGLKHKKLPVFGIQFHPESYKTEGGMTMLANFVAVT